MGYAFFRVNISCDGGVGEELNSFLRTHRVLGVDKRFVEHGEQSCWCFCVEFLEGEASGKKVGNGGSAKRSASQVDYKEILSEKEFAGFLRLRTLRKELAEKEGVPVYALFTNEQLAKMVQGKITTKKALGDIAGVGEARISKYGEAFLELLKTICSEDGIDGNETSNASQGANSGTSEPAPGLLESGPGEAEPS